MYKIFLAVAFVFSLMPATLAEAATPLSSDSDTVVIEVSGKIPGFTQPQLAAYLAAEMQKNTAGRWRFAAEKAGEEPAPNRVVWSFKTLRKVWEGGVHSGFPSPAHSVTYLRAEVKLYLNGVYQMTMDTHPTVSSGADDVVLSEMVHNAAHALFIEDKSDIR